MQLANQLAQQFNHDHIGTEHILLGLIKEGSGVGACALKHLGVHRHKVRIGIENRVRRGVLTQSAGRLPQNQQAKNVVQNAIHEAERLNHDYVGTEHILVGLMCEPAGVAAQVLMDNGLTLDNVRTETLRLLNAGIRLWPIPSRLTPRRPLYGPIDDLPESITAIVAEASAEIERLASRIAEAVAAHDSQTAATLLDEQEALVARREMMLRVWPLYHRIDAAWLWRNDSAALKLAREIGDLRCWDKLPTLAAALEEARCTDAMVLSHCRQVAHHSKECWVVNLLLAHVTLPGGS